MLHRPPTHDTVAGLERFVCLDLANAVLSRAACAARHVATIRPGGASASRKLDGGPCIGCPVGALHASERETDEARAALVSIASGRGTAAKPGRVGAIRPGSFATRPAPCVVAPAAVVPAKRPKTPDPMGRAPTPQGHRESPVEIEREPVPQVSTGQRPLVTCRECLVPFRARWHSEARCKPCRDRLGLSLYAGAERRYASQQAGSALARAARAANRARERLARAALATDTPAGAYRRGGRLITADGVTLSVTGWAVRNGWRDTVISNRLRGGWDPVRAVTEPLAERYRAANTRGVADAAE